MREPCGVCMACRVGEPCLEGVADPPETIGDEYRLDCPVCAAHGFDDLWDGALSGMLNETFDRECRSCGAACTLTLAVTVEITARPKGKTPA